MKMKNILRVLAGTAAILSVPLVAMQFTSEVQWNLFDFIVIGSLLIGAGLTYEFIAARVSAKRRWIAALVITAAVLLIWAELAVGVFGSPFAGS